MSNQSDYQHSHYAYGLSRSEVETVMRFAAVKRWHMIDTTRIQNLAEHSACVAALAYGIASKTSFFGPPEMVATRALFHDLGEVFTGDIPSHTKRHIVGIDNLEKMLLPPVWNTRGSVPIDLLIKLCDLADGIRFIRLHGSDITSVHARNGLEQQFDARKKETLDWPEEVRKIAFSWTHFYAYEQS